LPAHPLIHDRIQIQELLANPFDCDSITHSEIKP
jgi:hypothetical protein